MVVALPDMQYRTLGRTGLRVSLLGLGTGGPSQLGQTGGKSARPHGGACPRAKPLAA